MFRFSPFRLICLDPISEGAMADLRHLARFVLVARIDDNESPGAGEERAHVSAKHLILDQVIDYVEREHQIKATVVSRQLSGEIKAFGGVRGKVLPARGDRSLCHVNADIAWVPREGELGAIATAKL